MRFGHRPGVVAAVLFFCLLPLLSCVPLPPLAPAPRWPIRPGGPLRVALAEGTLEAAVGTMPSGDPSPGAGGASDLLIRPGPSGDLLVIRGQTASESPVTAPSPFRLDPPPGGGCVTFAGQPYRGSLSIWQRPDGHLVVVNVVDVEDYLRGVVPREIGVRTREVFEAVKAQAVAARTYALLSRGQYEPQGFDLYASVKDQVYDGIAAEKEPADRAIRETAGEVLTYEGALARTYYHAACGGETARIEEVWEKPPAPYLRGVRDRPPGTLEEESYCRQASRFRWEERWTAEELAQVLGQSLPVELGRPVTVTPADLKEVAVEAKGRSGRVKWLRISIGGETYRIFGDHVRWVLRPAGRAGAGLPSARFDLRARGRGGRLVELIAHGSGNGHGVGMCQSGAMEMSRRGKKHREILAHYYPGTRIVRCTEGVLSRCPAAAPLLGWSERPEGAKGPQDTGAGDPGRRGDFACMTLR